MSGATRQGLRASQRLAMQRTTMTKKTTAIGLLLALIGATAACATNQGTGTLIGTGAGAGLGAGIGALAGGGKGALIGGAVGAAAGAGSGALIGRYMDKQEADLKKLKAANVQRQGDKLVVKFNSAILFDTGKFALKPQAEKDLAEFGGVLKQYPETDLVIEGHTDNKGKKAKNQKLSNDRAEAVIAFLASQGVARSRMTGRGMADDRPVADNATEEGRQQNRRVEINIAANEKLQQEDAKASQAQSAKTP